MSDGVAVLFPAFRQDDEAGRVAECRAFVSDRINGVEHVALNRSGETGIRGTVQISRFVAVVIHQRFEPLRIAFQFFQMTEISVFQTVYDGEHLLMIVRVGVQGEKGLAAVAQTVCRVCFPACRVERREKQADQECYGENYGEKFYKRKAGKRFHFDSLQNGES